MERREATAHGVGLLAPPHHLTEIVLNQDRPKVPMDTRFTSDLVSRKNGMPSEGPGERTATKDV